MCSHQHLYMETNKQRRNSKPTKQNNTNPTKTPQRRQKNKTNHKKNHKKKRNKTHHCNTNTTIHRSALTNQQRSKSTIYTGTHKKIPKPPKKLSNYRNENPTDRTREEKTSTMKICRENWRWVWRIRGRKQRVDPFSIFPVFFFFFLECGVL